MIKNKTTKVDVENWGAKRFTSIKEGLDKKKGKVEGQRQFDLEIKNVPLTPLVHVKQNIGESKDTKQILSKIFNSRSLLVDTIQL